MPTITFNINATAMQRLQEVVDWTNQRNGTSLTVKQWAIITLKQAVVGTRMGKYRREDQAQDAAAFGEQLESEVDIT